MDHNLILDMHNTSKTSLIMRTAAALAAAFLSAAALGAQNLQYCGVPVSGTSAEFNSSLRSAGYTRTEGGSFEGPLFGRTVTLTAQRTPVSGTVYALQVTLPETSSWETAKKDYLFLKGKMQERYGGPDDAVEDLGGWEEDSNTFLRLREGEIQWWCLFDAPGGTVMLGIVPSETKATSGYVLVLYEDDRGADLLEKEE